MAGKQDDKADVLAYWLRLLAPDLPEPRREYLFNLPATRHRFDFCYPEARLAIEVDGAQWVAQGGRHNRDSDRVKLNLAAVRGWRVLRFSTDMLKHDPGGCVDVVRAALGR